MAGPTCLDLAIPATFTIAPSSAKLPFRPTTPPVGVIAFSTLYITSWFSGKVISFKFSSIVFPVTVIQSPCI